MAQRLQPILSLLDEGMLIYRRNFLRFVLIAAIWIVPLAILAGLGINALAWMSENNIMMLALVSLALMLPLMLYILGSLSRAAHTAIAGRPVLIGEALRIPITQLLGMSAFVLVYGALMYILTSSIFVMLLCPMYIFGVFGFGMLSFIDTGGSLGTGILFALFFGIMYLLGLAISGAGYSSTIYIIQPWIAQRSSFGKSIQQSMELATYRFLKNMAVWMASAVLAWALAFIIAATIGVLIPLPLLTWLGAESRIAQGGALAAMLLGLVLVLPPLPIWMALLYQRNVQIRSGAALDVAVQKWLEPQTVEV